MEYRRGQSSATDGFPETSSKTIWRFHDCWLFPKKDRGFPYKPHLYNLINHTIKNAKIGKGKDRKPGASMADS
jgi:hypothetical protein